MSTESLEEYRARMKRELSAANNADLLREVQAVQKARGWTFERSWNFVLAEQPAFARNAPERVDGVAAKEKSYARIEASARQLIAESGGRLTMGQALIQARA